MLKTFSRSSPTEAPNLAVLSPDTIKVFNDARQIKQLVSWIKSEYEKAKSARQRNERQWALNMAMYTGRQYMQYFPSNSQGLAMAGKLWTPPSPSWSARSITNRIRPVVRTEIARLVSNKPNASVVPASSEDQDLFAAQAAEQVWEAIYSGTKLHQKFSTSMFWMTICGTSFMKTWWDPAAYDCVTKENGSIVHAPVTPFHVFVPDLHEVDIENQPWLFNIYTKPVQWVKATYGIDVAPDVKEATTPYDSSLMTASLGDNEAKPDSSLVIEAWIKPNAHPLFPEGGMVTIAGELVVQISEQWPFNHKEYPFAKFDHIPTGGFYAESVVSDLIPLQREYNRTRNQIIEAKNRMAKPQLMAARGSVDAKKITSEPGLLIEYRPGLDPPRPLPIQPIPNYVIQELGTILSDIEDISSQHQVSRGQAPPGVTAATAISFMQERDDSLMTTAYQSIEAGYEKIAKQTLNIVVDKWEAPRIISVTGVDGSFDSVALKGSELEKGTDIRMEAGSALPVSKAAKQAFLLDLMKLGMIDPNKGLELMEMGGIDKLYDEIKIDERAAQRENLRMRNLDLEQVFQHVKQIEAANAEAQQMAEQMNQQMAMQGMQQGPPGMPPLPGMEDPSMGGGMPPMPGPAGMDQATNEPLQLPINIVPVNTWDNHQLHIDVHNRFRKSQAFDMLPDTIKDQFEAHVQMHAQALNQAAMNAMMMPPPPDGGMSAENGSGTPVGQEQGANQFGPPGTEEGAPPPEMMMGQ